jgi:hypothetical protein
MPELSRRLATPCPLCEAKLTTFEINGIEGDRIDLVTFCRHCDTAFKLSLTFDDLRELGRGHMVEADARGAKLRLREVSA